MTTPKPPRLIPVPGEAITHEQAAIPLDHYRDDAGELAAGIAVVRPDR
jgi:hypothetical protein